MSCGKEVELTSAERVVKGMETVMLSNGVDATMNMNMDIDAEALLATDLGTDLAAMPEASKGIIDLMNDMSVVANHKIKLDETELKFGMSYDYNIKYKDGDLLSLAVFLDNDQLQVKLPSLSDKYFSVTLAPVVEMIFGMAEMDEIKDMDFGKYISIMLNKESKTYKALDEANTYYDLAVKHFETRLSEGAKEDGLTVYSYDMNYDSMVDLMKEVSVTARADKNLKAHVNAVFREIIEEMKATGDYVYFDLTKEDVDTALLTLDIEMETIWNEFFDEFDANIESELTLNPALNKYAMNPSEIYDNLKIRLAIDDDNVLRRVDYTVKAEGIGYTVDYKINSYGDAVTLNALSGVGIDVVELLDKNSDQQLNEVKNLKLFAVDAIDALIGNETLMTIVEVLAPLDESGSMTPDGMVDMLNMGKMYLQMFADEDLRDLLNNSF